MDIKETISEGVEQFKEHIPDMDTNISSVVEDDASAGFWVTGLPGWVFPTLFSLHVLIVAVFASVGSTIADNFLTKHWMAETGWMGVIFVPWLSYKSFKGWHRSKERTAVKTTQINAAASLTTKA